MYVRTLNGIVKIDKIQNDVMKDTKGCLHYGDFIRASNNIIDLIEVGDYVNGCRVISINISQIVGHYSYVKCINDNVFKENEIKSIVTKEMFENVSYKVD